MSRDVIVADTSCLIVLQNINELPLLQKLFGKVSITEEVREEFGLPLPEWIKICAVTNLSKKDSLSLILDKGEASSIALCLESSDALLIIDERKGRRIANELKIQTIGTIGILLAAKKNDLIKSTDTLIQRMEDAGFYISQNLKEKMSQNNPES